MENIGTGFEGLKIEGRRKKSAGCQFHNLHILEIRERRKWGVLGFGNLNRDEVHKVIDISYYFGNCKFRNNWRRNSTKVLKISVEQGKIGYNKTDIHKLDCFILNEVKDLKRWRRLHWYESRFGFIYEAQIFNKVETEKYFPYRRHMFSLVLVSWKKISMIFLWLQFVVWLCCKL